MTFPSGIKRRAAARIAEAALISTAVFLPVPAQALFGAGGCSCGAISALHEETRRHTTKESTDAARHVVDGLREHARQTSSHLDRQVEADKRIADGQDQNAALRMRDRFRAEAENGKFDPNSDYCMLYDLSADSKLRSKAFAPAHRDIERMAKQWSTGVATPVRENGTRMAAWLAAERVDLRNAGGSEDATTDWGLVTGHPTIPVFDSATKRAVARLVSNTIDPAPPIPLTENDMRTPAGLSEAARRRSTEARNQAASSAIGMAIELGSPVHPADTLRTLASRSHYSNTIPEMVSELQRLDIRTSLYFEPNSETLDLRHAKNERALLQDLIDLQSLNAKINYFRLAQENRTSLVLAAILGILTDGSTSNLISN